MAFVFLPSLCGILRKQLFSVDTSLKCFIMLAALFLLKKRTILKYKNNWKEIFLSFGFFFAVLCVKFKPWNKNICSRSSLLMTERYSLFLLNAISCNWQHWSVAIKLCQDLWWVNNQEKSMQSVYIPFVLFNKAEWIKTIAGEYQKKP